MEAPINKRKCTRCTVSLPIDMFSIRRNREYNKMCDDCLQKSRIKNNNTYSDLIQGFKNTYNLDFETIKKDYCYSGGDFSNHLNYFKLCFPGKKTPPTINKCVCGHVLKRNCYISKEHNYETLIILGNCCITKFINKHNRSCSECGAQHKNRNINKCNDCKNKCVECNDISTNLKENKCKNCRYRYCGDCNELSHGYPLCKDCYFNN